MAQLPGREYFYDEFYEMQPIPKEKIGDGIKYLGEGP